MSVLQYKPRDLSTLSDAELQKLAADFLDLQAVDRQHNQLRYYKPVSPLAGQIHSFTAKTIGVGGGNGCQVAGTRVVTGRGVLPIEEVVVGDTVPGNARWPGKVVALYTSPAPVPVYRVRTKRGYTMEGSADHLNSVCGARRREWHNAIDADRKCKWVKLENLSGVDFEANPTFITLATSTAFPSKCDITPDDAYFLGQMVGDGHWLCKSGTNRMGWTTNDDDAVTIQWMKSYLESRGINYSVTHKNQANGTSITWCNRKFTSFIESCGVTRSLGPDKCVPEKVWRGTRSVVAAFIRGLADSDGCATTKPSVVIVNQSEKLLRGVHALLRRFKITCSLRWQPPIGGPKHENGIWRLEICGRNLRPYASNIGFLLPSKSARLASIKAAKRKQQFEKHDRIVSVERVADQTVYGLTITPKPEYVADGFLQHNSSKTDTSLAEMVIRATGQIPLSLRDTYPREKLRGPIACRVVCESLTTTLVPIILPKLQWWRWSGVGQQGSDKGHWGWIPKHCLIGGEWSKSWTEKLRMLRLLYRDPERPEKVLGESMIQFMSYDQDSSDFASGDFHFILHDEPPKYDIWRENRARAMRVDGTLMLAMTWPDDPTIPVEWIVDELYEKGVPGPAKDPNVEWLNLYTTDNPHLNQNSVAERAAQMSDTERATRIYGQPIRMSNRVHPLFTDTDREWCFQCNQPSIAVEDGTCGKCGNELTTYNHVQNVKAESHYPVLYVLDPHPRKPHCMAWIQVDSNDDLAQVAELEFDGGPEELWEAVQNVESDYGWSSIRRIMDPNMGRSPSDARRELTWQEAFERAGLVCDLADDSDVGSKVFDTYLKPDPSTHRPRAIIDPRCVRTIYQIRRFLWDDHKKAFDREQKQQKKKRHDDFPGIWRYALNTDPSFRALRNVGQVYRRQGERGEHGY